MNYQDMLEFISIERKRINDAIRGISAMPNDGRENPIEVEEINGVYKIIGGGLFPKNNWKRQSIFKRFINFEATDYICRQILSCIAVIVVAGIGTFILDVISKVCYAKLHYVLAGAIYYFLLLLWMFIIAVLLVNIANYAAPKIKILDKE